jgi:hypothetical protein
MPQPQQQQQQQPQPRMPHRQQQLQQPRMQQPQPQQFHRIPPIPPPLPAMGVHMLLVTGRSGQESGVLDPCVDEIASCLGRQFPQRQRQQQEDDDDGDGSTDSEYDSDSAYDEEWNRRGGAFFPNRRSSSFDRAGRSPSPPPRPKRPKLTRRDDGTGAGHEEGTASKDGGDDHDDDDDSMCESDCDSKDDDDDDAMVRRLAERCCHPLSRSFAASVAPCMVHVVETLSELDDVGVAMDHVVLIHRDLDTLDVAGAALSLHPGGGSARTAHQGTNGTATAGPNAFSQGLSAEDRRALRRNMIMSGDWERRISRVRIANQPFATLPPPQRQQQQHWHDTGGGLVLPPAQQHLHDNGDFEVPTFVCHEYDPNSIRQVARILRTIAGGHARPRRPPLKPPT